MDYRFEEKKLSEKLTTVLAVDFEIIQEPDVYKNPGVFIVDGMLQRRFEKKIIKGCRIISKWGHT